MAIMVERLTPRFLIAKFVPDLRRLEPRNIGVIVWANGQVSARFAGERDDERLDLRSVPSFVGDKRAYDQWVHFWRKILRAPAAVPLKGGSGVPIESPEYLDALKSNSLDSFYLAEGGVLLDPVVDIKETLNFLFTNLVSGADVISEREETLERICNALAEEARFSRSPHYKRAFRLPVQLDGGPAEFQFSYASVNGKVNKLFQRVPVSDKPADAQKSVLSAAFMFERVTEAGIIGRQDTAALVRAGDDTETNSEILNELAILRSYTRVLDVTVDREEIITEFREAAAL